MWTFGHSVTEVDRSSRCRRNSDRMGLIVGAYFGAMALCASVTSSYIGDRNRHMLLVTRKIWPWANQRIYAAKDIDRVYVRHGFRGSGLAVRLTSGTSKNLMMSFDSAAGIDELAATLNEFWYVPHRGSAG